MLLHSVTLILLHTQAQKTADTHQPTNNHNNQIVIKISFDYNWNCILDFNFAAQNQSSKWGCDSSGQKTSCAS